MRLLVFFLNLHGKRSAVDCFLIIGLHETVIEGKTSVTNWHPVTASHCQILKDLAMPKKSGSLTNSFVLGGARSGKSSYAEQLVESQPGDCLYVATATVWDTEMEDRIEEHRSRRGGRWTTYEEPLELVRCLRNIARPDATILVDCLTLWVTNLMMEGRNPDVEGAQLVASLSELNCPVVLVSNEVGLGIVPMDKMSRDFRDYAGRLHQRLAAVVPSVTFMVSGLPMQVKPAIAQSI